MPFHEFLWCPLKHQQSMTKECWMSEWWWLTVNVQWVSEWQWHGHFLCNVVFSDRAGKSVFLSFVFKLWKFVLANIVHVNRNPKQAPKLAAKVLLRNHFFLVSPRRRRYHSLEREAFSAWRSHAAGPHWISPPRCSQPLNYQITGQLQYTMVTTDTRARLWGGPCQ